jgi:hypothetical protein
LPPKSPLQEEEDDATALLVYLISEDHAKALINLFIN